MSSSNDLLRQPGTLQQPPLIEKRDNSSWKAFSILLVIVNLPLVGGIILGLIDNWLAFGQLDLEYNFRGFIQSMISWSPFLLPLAIMDYITVSSYRKKRPPPWKVFFIPLVVVNVIFFSLASWGLSQSGGGAAAPVLTVIALVLLLIDSVAILSYSNKHLTHRKAKVILYTVLASVIFGLIFLGILVLGVILSPHY